MTAFIFVKGMVSSVSSITNKLHNYAYELEWDGPGYGKKFEYETVEAACKDLKEAYQNLCLEEPTYPEIGIAKDAKSMTYDAATARITTRLEGCY